MKKQTLTGSIILTSLIGLTACGSHMVVDDGPVPVGPNGTGGAGGGSQAVVSVSSTGGFGPTPQECGGFVDPAINTVKPVDIIVVIDNSKSMEKEIKAVEENINTNLAEIIGNSGLDYRVILLSRHGTAPASSSIKPVCINEPLADFSNPTAGCESGQLPGIIEGKFYHYSKNVKSTDSLTLLLTQFAGANAGDELGLAPGGYHQWLRPDAFKIFIEITDDNVDGYEVDKNVEPGFIFNDGDTVEGGEQAAAEFDAQLLKLSPEQFGTPEARNYRFYSIVGMPNKDPQNPNEPWLPEDPFTKDSGTCAADSTNHGRQDAGTGYQALSRLTGGLRFSLCNPEGFNVVFNHIAQGVIDQQQVACEYDLPEVSEGEQIDLSSVSVDYTAGGETTAVVFEQVADEAACTDDAFYVDGEVVRLCAQTCATVQADLSAELEWGFMCLDEIN